MTTDEMLDMMREVAATVITPRFRALADGEVDEKTPGDFVTIADREAEAVITRILRERYPQATIVGEEAVYADPTVLEGIGGAHVFTVDPVDGTKNFVKGSDEHAVMIAELEHGTPVRSWIWQPEFHLAYVAERGAGVTCNGQPVVREPDGGLPRGACSGSARTTLAGAPGLAPVQMTHMCAGVDYPMILEGDSDYVIYMQPKPWDHLPGLLMLQEMGGGIVRVDGQPYTATSGSDCPIVCSYSLDLAHQVAALLRERA